MWTIIWNFIKPYVSNIFVWVILTLVIIAGVQTARVFFKDTVISSLKKDLEIANIKLAAQQVEFTKLKVMADALDIKLKTAYAENVEIEKRHAKTIEVILTSKLPETATCEETAKWAKEIARRKSK
jgi:uncharacterized protein with PIN domain